MTQQELENLKSTNPFSTEFGAVTEIHRWPVIVLTYSPDGQPPMATGQKEEMIVTTKEGELPEVSGQNPMGEAILPSEVLGALPSWPVFEQELKAALEENWTAQQERLAAERAVPAPPEDA